MRSQGGDSQWAPFLDCLPEATLSPVLWSEELQTELLQNSPTLKECRQRRAALRQEWDTISQRIASSDTRRFSQGGPGDLYGGTNIHMPSQWRGQ